MRKKIIYIVVAIFLAGMVSESLYGQSARRQQRDLDRMDRQAELDERRAEIEARQARTNANRIRTEQLESEGWRMEGHRTIRVAVEDHANAMSELGLGQESIQTVPSARSINLGRQTALANVQVFYATRVGSEVQGRIGAVMRYQGVPQEDIDRTMSQFATRVQADVSGVLTESFTIVRDSRGGGFDVRVFFIIDEGRAAVSRRRALEESIRETILVGIELDEIFRAVEQPITF